MNTHTHTLLTLLHSFQSHLTEAVGALVAKLSTNSASSPASAQLSSALLTNHTLGASPAPLFLLLVFFFFLPRFFFFFFFIWKFAACVSVRVYVCVHVCVCCSLVVSMQGNERHRHKESRGTWTNRPLVLYKCTLYLFIFSLELKRSASGE